jgi:ribosomal protein S18 acetylase RimI-like enzyme
VSLSVKPSFRRATLNDLGALLALMPLYYADDHLEFEPVRAETALRLFLSDSSIGQIWMIDSGGESIGYIAVPFGFSLEFGGREAFVDELFVRSDFRGKGVGSGAIAHAIEECRGLGIRALRLEVTGSNARAHALYTRLGFEDLGRSLLSYEL